MYGERKGTEYASVKRLEGTRDIPSSFKLSEQPCKGQLCFKHSEGEGDWSFLYPFTQQTFIECLLCAKHSVAKCGPRVEIRHFFYPKEPWFIRMKTMELINVTECGIIWKKKCLGVGQGTTWEEEEVRSHGCTCLRVEDGWEFQAGQYYELKYRDAMSPWFGVGSRDDEPHGATRKKRPGWTYGRQSGPLASSHTMLTNSSRSRGSPEGGQGRVRPQRGVHSGLCLGTQTPNHLEG